MSQRIFFASATSDGRIGLFTSENSVSSAVEIVVADSQVTGVQPQAITVVGSFVLFYGLDKNGTSSLFQYDGVSGTVSKLSVSGSDASGLLAAGQAPIFPPIVVGTNVLFAGLDATGHPGLFCFNALTGAAGIVTAAGASAAGLSPSAPVLVGTKLLFAGHDSAGQTSLFVTDPSTTTATTVPVASAGSSLSPSSITVVGGKALFIGNDAQGKTGLFAYDAGSGSAAEVASLNAGLGTTSTILAVGTKALFTTFTAGGYSALGIYDATTNTAAPATIPSQSYYGITARMLTLVGSKIVFQGLDRSLNSNLFQYDPATDAVTEITVRGASSALSPTAIGAIGTTAVFIGTDARGINGLFYYDTATGAGGEITVAGSPGNDSFNPTALVAVGSKIVFTTIDASGLIGLFSYDPATAQAQEITAPGFSAFGAGTDLAHVERAVRHLLCDRRKRLRGPVVDRRHHRRHRGACRSRSGPAPLLQSDPVCASRCESPVLRDRLIAQRGSFRLRPLDGDSLGDWPLRSLR